MNLSTYDAVLSAFGVAAPRKLQSTVRDLFFGERLFLIKEPSLVTVASFTKDLFLISSEGDLHFSSVANNFQAANFFASLGFPVTPCSPAFFDTPDGPVPFRGELSFDASRRCTYSSYVFVQRLVHREKKKAALAKFSTSCKEVETALQLGVTMDSVNEMIRNASSDVERLVWRSVCGDGHYSSKKLTFPRAQALSSLLKMDAIHRYAPFEGKVTVNTRAVLRDRAVALIAGGS